MNQDAFSIDWRHMLVVGDDPQLAGLVSLSVEESGHSTHLVCSGSAALQWLSSNSAILVIVDLNIPDMTCEAFIEAVEAHSREIPVVVAGESGDHRFSLEMLRRGARDFLLKDVTLPERLAALFLRSLQEMESRRSIERLKSELSVAKERLGWVQESASLVLWEWNIQEKSLWLSERAMKILGYDDPEYPEPTMEFLLSQINQSDLHRVRHVISDAIQTGRLADLVCTIRDKNGNEMLCNSKAELKLDPLGRPRLMSGVTINLSDREKAQDVMHELANFDSLTGLPNRNLLVDRLRQSIVHAARYEKRLAVLLLDIDGLRDLNDLLGHWAVDKLLRTVAERLSACLRDSDTLARIGGDEFVVLFNSISGEEGIAATARKMLSVITEPLSLDDHEISLSASVGVSIYPVDGDDPLSLLNHADLARLQAKGLGRNSFQLFSREMHLKIMERMELEGALRRALERNEFELFYQPQVDLKKRRITGFEGLIRWRHPELGIIPPDKFIPFAEETGLILPIGEWVIRAAVSQAKEWKYAGLPCVTVAVNLSVRQFRTRLDELIRAVLTDVGLEAGLLELEMTESILMNNVDENRRLLQALADIGCALSIDDFGTGYSSLAYLKHFPLRRLKIDRTFVSDIANNSDDQVIARVIIDMARTLRMNVIAEGVETREQMEILYGYGCFEMQGYLYSRPVSAESATSMLRDGFNCLSGLELPFGENDAT